MPRAAERGFGAGERPTAGEAPVSGERGWVDAAESRVFRRVDKRNFFLGVTSPEQEDDVVFPCADRRDHGVGEAFPAEFSVAPGGARVHGEDAVEQDHDDSAWVLQKLFPVGSAGMFKK